MLAVMKHAELDAFFRQLGCDTSVPGFCDQERFREAERTNPGLLDRYADFIVTHPSAADPVIVKTTSDFVFDRLRADGRLGACIDASSLLSEFLTRQGIWNIVVGGGASIQVGNAPAVRMAPIGPKGSPATVGHAWVVAPPFQVIDVTLALQPYDRVIRKSLAIRPIIACGLVQVTPRIQEIVDPEVEADVLRAGGPRVIVGEERWGRIAVLGSWRIQLSQNVVARYVGFAARAMDAPMDEWENICLGGLSPIQLWERFEGGT